MQDDFSAVVKKHAVGAVGQLVAKTVFRREVDEFGHELGSGLGVALLNKSVMVDGQGDCSLDFGQFRLGLVLSLLGLGVDDVVRFHAGHSSLLGWLICAVTSLELGNVLRAGRSGESTILVAHHLVAQLQLSCPVLKGHGAVGLR